MLGWTRKTRSGPTRAGWLFEVKYDGVRILAGSTETQDGTGNPYEAFEQLGKRVLSLILTDLHMPGGGIEFLGNLRGADVLCPIIVITGLGGDTVRDAAMTAGATVFLEKPIRTKQLREIVTRFLSSTPTIA